MSSIAVEGYICERVKLAAAIPKIRESHYLFNNEDQRCLICEQRLLIPLPGEAVGNAADWAVSSVMPNGYRERAEMSARWLFW